MKKCLKLAILNIIFATLLITPVFAKPNSNPVNKVTGEIWFPISSGTRTAHAKFNAHDVGDEGQDKGKLYFEIPAESLYYKIDVYSVNIIDNKAYVGGPVVESNIESVRVGKWVFVYLIDGGTPGRKGDQWWANCNYKNTVLNWVSNGAGFNPTLSNVLNGNLVVHTYELAS